MTYGYVVGDSLVVVESGAEGKPVTFTDPPESIEADRLHASYADEGDKILQSWREIDFDALKDEQIKRLASIIVKESDLTRAEAISLCRLYDEWSGKGVSYKKGQWLQYGADFVRVEQDHTSQPDWTPDAAPSLYTRFKLAPDGVRIWEEPTRAENAFDIDEQCHYPGADGPIYTSKIEGNTTVPGSDDRWWTKED